MISMRRTILVVVSIALFMPAISFAVSLTASTGYETDTDLYDGGDKPIAVVFLHGKYAVPDTKFNSIFTGALSDAGHDVIVPYMTWSRDNKSGSLQDSFAVIDAAINKISGGSKKVVVVGHSMGAAVAALYAAQFGNDKLAGIVPIAIGHVPQLSGKIASATESSVMRARELMKAGRAKDIVTFIDVNKGQETEVETTVEFYHAHYDTQVYPDIRQEIPRIKVPVLMISGNADRLTEVNEHFELAALLPAKANSRRETVKGKHLSVLKFTTDIVIDWMSGL